MQSFKFNVVTGFLALSALSLGAAAAEVATFGDLAKIQAQTTLLKAQAKQEDARAELASKRAIGADSDGTLPVLKSILNGDIVIYPGNVKVPARVGDVIPGGYIVAEANDAAQVVHLRKGRDKYSVGFSAVVPTARATAKEKPQNAYQMPSIIPPGQ
ncbi:hypothetical protein ACFQAT_28995 [Undibacterium arcticum]|uniref:hypothetical protein n=1 Tax=Undibacterium arcticum TaxID=1762892 RepID=UPI00361DEDA6